MDTIFALASAAGKAGVSIIRVSGPDALAVCRSLGFELGQHDRRVVRILDVDGSLIDVAFALSFHDGRSFTGEPVVELHTHGSPAIVRSVLGRLGDLGLRLAEPGEFTRRAMENGRLDLAQVEGLADLIDAETEAQREQAVRVFEGALGKLAEEWRQKLVRAAALLEATIDFVDEDVPVDVFPEVRELVKSVHSEVTVEAKGVRVRERLRDGFEVALVGLPNSGKSTLLNRLAGRDAAMTSDIAGTTRDVIEVRMDLDGFPLTFLDTAGVRDSNDVLEELGIERGIARAKVADVRVHLVSDLEKPVFESSDGLDLIYLAKADLVDGDVKRGISGRTGIGVERLLAEISAYLQGQVARSGVATRERHRLALVKSAKILLGVVDNLSFEEAMVDLIADDLRNAILALDSLIGRVDVEHVLDDIFSSFCIGK